MRSKFVGILMLLALLGGVAQGQDSLNVKKVGELPLTDCQCLAVHDNYAYLACGDSGLVIADISDPEHPIIVGELNPPLRICNLCVSGNYIYASDEQDYLYIIDVSNPENPMLVGSLNIHFIICVTVSGNYAYVGSAFEFIIVDISNPLQPQIIGSDWGDIITEIAISGNYAYAAFNYAQSVYIYDVADPITPHLSTHYNVGGPSWDVLLSGDIAFTANNYGAIQVEVISNPANPTNLGMFYSYSPKKLAISDNYLFTTAHDSGFKVFRVDNLLAIGVVGYFNTPGIAKDVAVQGDYVYVADQSDFSIYDWSDVVGVLKPPPNPSPSTFTFPPPHPNPFNPTTTLSFELRVASFVTLEIFDINGRVVGAPNVGGGGSAGARCAPLQDTWYDAGTHTIPFDGSNLPSGIYFARLTAGEYSSVQKLVLMK
ncbi:MAG: hypothetical protein NTW14_12570 [bacterium]|nr:hypothetical protein [bacterium]